jgi:hypothetical protein
MKGCITLAFVVLTTKVVACSVLGTSHREYAWQGRAA